MAEPPKNHPPVPVVAIVLACGYQQVAIPKSGLSFPAWLVCIKNQDDDDNTTCRYEWRTKRDFWRLARQMNGFPKAAWNNLCQVAPWKRPDFEMHIASDSTAISDNNKNGYDPRNLTDETENNWQPVMKKSLFQLDQFLQRMASLAESEESLAAWSEFVNETFGESHFSTTGSIKSLMHKGNALGQYFCHPDNARQLVRTALSRLELVCGTTPNTKQSILFVEPSCGYGQIVETLLQELQPSQSPTAFSDCQLQGVDLDPIAIEKCRGKFHQKDGLKFVCSNFLQTLPSDLFAEGSESIVVMVGGPPYTAGAGQGGSDESSLCRDLPMQFVRHSVQAYSAAVVCLLMPARCQRIDYVKEGWIPAHYDYETVQLEEASVFFFQGGNPVTQPSVIQCFWKQRD